MAKKLGKHMMHFGEGGQVYRDGYAIFANDRFVGFVPKPVKNLYIDDIDVNGIVTARHLIKGRAKEWKPTIIR